MRGLSPKLKKSRRLAAIIGTSVLLSLGAASAQAAAPSSDVVTVTTKMPDIKTEADRTEAIKAFRAKASDACEVKGRKGISVWAQERACTDDLVKTYEQKIDVRMKSVASKPKSKTTT